MSLCMGIVNSTGTQCKSKAQDINGFCGRHYKQSIEYAKTHKWSAILVKTNGGETLVKVSGIIPGAFTTSEHFGH